MVEGARLESVYRGNSIEGSNPSLSAITSNQNKLQIKTPVDISVHGRFLIPVGVVRCRYRAR